MYKTFSSQGNWWLPDTPDLKVGGILDYASNSGLILTLADSLMGDIYNRNYTFPIINGVLIGNAKPITLLKCFLTSVATPSIEGVGTTYLATLKANYAFIGQIFKSEEEILFSSISASYDNLEEWVNGKPFLDKLSIDDSSATTHNFHERPLIDLGNYRISIWDTFSSHRQTHKRSEEHHAYVSVSYDEPTNFIEITAKLNHLRNFITLGIGSSIKLKKLYGFTTADGIDEIDLITPYRNVASINEDNLIYNDQMIFSLDNLGSHIEASIKAWFAKEERLKPVFDLYFAVVDTHSMYIDTQFELLTRTLEVYHRRIYGGFIMSEEKFDTQLLKPLTNFIKNELPDIPNDQKATLLQKVNYWNEFSLRKRLKELIQTLKSHFGSQLARLIGDESSFVDFVVNTRNDLTHYSSQKPQIINDNFHTNIYRLKTLIVMCFLVELGLPSVLGAEIVEKLQDFKIATHQFG